MDNRVEKFLTNLKDKKIALVGIGTSNLPLIKLFSKYGASVLACDKRDKNTLGENGNKAIDAGATLSLGDNYIDNLDVDIIFRTPGMRYYTPQLVEYRKKGVVVTSEMELFFDLCPCEIIAITGSDGKTTTTSIIAEMLKEEGRNVYLGGNIGTPLLPQIENINSTDIAVVELSSFQLISMRKSADVSVITNLAPNHLDIHKDMQEYIDAKKNILLHQNAFGKAVLNLDNDITNNLDELCRGTVYKFSRQNQVENGAYLSSDNNIIFALNGTETKIININEIKIPGMHNVENYMTAICATWGKVSLETIKKVAKEFGGVEHRAEFVRELNGVKYYNDSIASSPTRTASGTLSLYDKRIILIAGGYDKKISYEPLGPVIAKKVKKLILMGNTASKIEKAVKECNEYNSENIEIINVENMAQAVEKAYEIAQNGDIVSMSPASASFDLYKNFDERGKDFKNLVQNLK